MQQLVFDLIKLHYVHIGSLFKLVQHPFLLFNFTTQLIAIILSLNPNILVIDKGVEEHWF